MAETQDDDHNNEARDDKYRHAVVMCAGPAKEGSHVDEAWSPVLLPRLLPQGSAVPFRGVPLARALLLRAFRVSLLRCTCAPRF